MNILIWNNFEFNLFKPIWKLNFWFKYNKLKKNQIFIRDWAKFSTAESPKIDATQAKKLKANVLDLVISSSVF